MKDKNNLPLFGVGPLIIAPMVAITIIFIILDYYSIIPSFTINQIIITVIGIILIILGAVFWLMAVLDSKIDDNIKSDKLVTTGIYGIVRHPIYAAFLYVCTGLILTS